MAVYRAVSAFFIASVASYLLGQGVPVSKRPSTPAPQEVALTEVATTPVGGLPAESIEARFSCDPDGRIFLRLAMPDTGIEDPVSVSRDGKTLVRFGREKIYDVPQPSLTSVFLVGSDVYILGLGRTPLGYDTKWRTPSGEIESHAASKLSTFVAHFDKDGKYAGSVRLDLPFGAQQMGVFANGDFLISGIQGMRQARVAIVGSNGQLRRYLELNGDVHVKEESAASEKDPGAFPAFGISEGSTDSSPRETLFDVVSTSRIVQDGQNLLLFRPTAGPIYSIAPSGDVHVHKLEVEGGYKLFTIKPTRNAWIVEFIRDLPNGGGQEFATFTFDPDSGKPLREYFFRRDLGWGLACVDGDEFTFVTANEKTKSIDLVKLAPK